MVKDQRAAGALMVDGRAETGEVDYDRVDGGCLSEGSGNCWDFFTTR